MKCGGKAEGVNGSKPAVVRAEENKVVSRPHGKKHDSPAVEVEHVIAKSRDEIRKAGKELGAWADKAQKTGAAVCRKVEDFTKRMGVFDEKKWLKSAVDELERSINTYDYDAFDRAFSAIATGRQDPWLIKEMSRRFGISEEKMRILLRSEGALLRRCIFELRDGRDPFRFDLETYGMLSENGMSPTLELFSPADIKESIRKYGIIKLVEVLQKLDPICAKQLIDYARSYLESNEWIKELKQWYNPKTNAIDVTLKNLRAINGLFVLFKLIDPSRVLSAVFGGNVLPMSPDAAVKYFASRLNYISLKPDSLQSSAQFMLLKENISQQKVLMEQFTLKAVGDSIRYFDSIERARMELERSFYGLGNKWLSESAETFLREHPPTNQQNMKVLREIAHTWKRAGELFPDSSFPYNEFVARADNSPFDYVLNEIRRGGVDIIGKPGYGLEEVVKTFNRKDVKDTLKELSAFDCSDLNLTVAMAMAISRLSPAMREALHGTRVEVAHLKGAIGLNFAGLIITVDERYVGSFDDFLLIFVHECAHSLARRMPKEGRTFNERWEKVAGDVYNGRTTKIRTADAAGEMDPNSAWTAYDDKEAHYGCVCAYGCEQLQEDIATFVMKVVTNPRRLQPLLNASRSDYDPRYRQKLDLLLEYGFITREQYEKCFPSK